jgi:hypothetical protein
MLCPPAAFKTKENEDCLPRQFLLLDVYEFRARLGAELGVIDR